jgi:hypothetical protein
MKNIKTDGGILMMTLVFGILLVGSILAGCASSPVINNFMNPGLPAAEHSVLSVHNNVMINNVDGDYTLRTIGGSGRSTFKQYPSILLMPGKHILEVLYKGYRV